MNGMKIQMMCMSLKSDTCRENCAARDNYAVDALNYLILRRVRYDAAVGARGWRLALSHGHCKSTIRANTCNGSCALTSCMRCLCPHKIRNDLLNILLASPSPLFSRFLLSTETELDV
jgi:hypothetical protein